jgi:hypothetical protein
MSKELIEQIKKLVISEPLKGEWSKKPLISSEIEAMEEKLGFTFPKEYKEFLEIFGYLDPGWGNEILGKVPPRLKSDPNNPKHLVDGFPKWSVAGQTFYLRKGYSTFPKNCAAISFDGGDGWYCIVCEGKDKGKVIYWDSYCDPKQVYPNIPTPEWFIKHPNWDAIHVTKKKEDFWVEGLDFWSWLLKETKERKRRKEENLKREAKQEIKWAKKK